MIFILDTHTMLWTIFDSLKLSKKTSDLISERSNNVVASSLSFWELSLKFSLGKIQLDVNPEHIPIMLEKVGIETIHPSTSDFASFHHLPTLKDHRDPFDRMLIWQAIRNDMTMISRDKTFKKYQSFGLKLLW